MHAEEKSKYNDIKDQLIREQQKRNELLDFVDNLKNMINQGKKSQVQHHVLLSEVHQQIEERLQLEQIDDEIH